MPVPCAFFFSGGRPGASARGGFPGVPGSGCAPFPPNPAGLRPCGVPPQGGENSVSGETSENGESCKSGESGENGAFLPELLAERPNWRDFRRRETIPGPEHRCLRRLSRSFPDCRGNAERPLNSRSAPAPPDARFPRPFPESPGSCGSEEKAGLNGTA